MVSSRKSRAKVREGKKPFEVSVVVQQRVVVHTAVKIWKTYKLIYVQCLCLKCYKLDIFRNSFKRNKSQSYLRIIAQNFKEWRFFKKLIILALFFHLLEHFVSIYIVCVFFGSLGWPFLYLKLWTKYGFIVLAFFLAPTGCSAALMVVAEDQTHISSRGILQQPKVFVLDETFFVSKILTGCCFMPPSLSTFEVKLITSFIWFVHWTKKHIPTSLPETDKEKLACQSSS